MSQDNQQQEILSLADLYDNGSETQSIINSETEDNDLELSSQDEDEHEDEDEDEDEHEDEDEDETADLASVSSTLSESLSENVTVRQDRLQTPPRGTFNSPHPSAILRVPPETPRPMRYTQRHESIPRAPSYDNAEDTEVDEDDEEEEEEDEVPWFLDRRGSIVESDVVIGNTSGNSSAGELLDSDSDSDSDFDSRRRRERASRIEDADISTISEPREPNQTQLDAERRIQQQTLIETSEAIMRHINASNNTHFNNMFENMSMDDPRSVIDLVAMEETLHQQQQELLTMSDEELAIAMNNVFSSAVDENGELTTNDPNVMAVMSILTMGGIAMNREGHIPEPNAEGANNTVVPAEAAMNGVGSDIVYEYHSLDPDVQAEANRKRRERKRRREMANNNENEEAGIFELAEQFAVIGRKADKRNNGQRAMQYYKMALGLDESNECSMEYAVILERSGKTESAIYWYGMSIYYNEDVLAMFNLADLYRKKYQTTKRRNRRQNTDPPVVPDIKDLEMAIKYYSMAADLGDNESLQMAMALSYKFKPGSFCKYYSEILNNLKDHYVWLYDEDTEPSVTEYSTFLKTHSVLDVWAYLSESEDIRKITCEDTRKQVQQCISDIEKHQHYTIYKNKVTLFEKLNHRDTCPICYDDETLHIDMTCGHCVCTECYKRVYMQKCPMCRMATCFDFFDGSETN